MSDAIPAASLILLHEPTDGAPELLMVERAGGMAFAAGALVFPGGRVDPGDHMIATDPALVGTQADQDETAARVAAIRETIEEAGVAVGIDPLPGAAALAALRAALAEGAAFAALLRAGRHRLDLGALCPFARWRPGVAAARIFDTRFYLAAAPADRAARPDGAESVRAFWGSATAILADAAAGRGRLVFPTRLTLERLAPLPSLAAARDHAACYPETTITPWIEERANRRWLCIPEGCGYPITAELLDSALRG